MYGRRSSGPGEHLGQQQGGNQEACSAAVERMLSAADGVLKPQRAKMICERFEKLFYTKGTCIRDGESESERERRENDW